MIHPFIWPNTRNPQGGILVLLGRFLHWVGIGVAIFALLWTLSIPELGSRPIYGVLAFVFASGARGLRYVLSKE